MANLTKFFAIIAFALLLTACTNTAQIQNKEKANNEETAKQAENVQESGEEATKKITGATKDVPQEEEVTEEVASSVKEFSMDSFTEIIDGKYFPQFSVKNITVKKGDTVRLKINTTSGEHNFKIDEFNI